MNWLGWTLDYVLRDLICIHINERHVRAKAFGVHVRRPPKLTALQKKEVIKRRDKGENLRDFARSYYASHSTISRMNEG